MEVDSVGFRPFGLVISAVQGFLGGEGCEGLAAQEGTPSADTRRLYFKASAGSRALAGLTANPEPQNVRPKLIH